MSFHKIFLSFIFLFLYVHFSFAQKSNPYTNLIEQDAISAFEEKDYEKAITYYKKLLVKQDKNIQVLRRLGQCHFHLNNLEKAKKYFSLAILYAKKPDAYAISFLSAVYTQLGEKDKAYETALKAYKIEQNDATVINLSSALLELKRPDECLEIVDNYTVGVEENEFEVIRAFAYNQKGDMKRCVYYSDLFFLYEGSNPKSSDKIKNHKFNLWQFLLDDYIKKTNQNRNAETYKPKIDSLFTEVVNSIYQQQGLKKLVKMYAENQKCEEYLLNLMKKSPEYKAILAELYISKKEYEKILAMYESETHFSKTDLIIYNSNFILLYGKTKDKKYEPIIMKFYEANNSDNSLIEDFIELAYEAKKMYPDIYPFLRKVFETTKDSELKEKLLTEF